MTIRQTQRIEQITGIITEWSVPDEPKALKINRLYGWDYDVRWGDEDYISDSDFTRVENDKLSPDHIVMAIRLSRHWRQGNFIPLHKL